MHGTLQTASAATSATKKLLVGNLPDNTRTSALKDIFAPIGKILSVSILGHGFAFVEMNTADADLALAQLRGSQFGGKAMMLDEAHPRTPSRY